MDLTVESLPAPVVATRPFEGVEEVHCLLVSQIARLDRLWEEALEGGIRVF